VEKYDRTRQATDDYIIRRTRFECWINKVIERDTQNKSYLLFFHGKNGLANAPHCHVCTYIACLVLISEVLS